MTETLASVDDVLSLGVTADEQVIAASLAKASARFRSEARCDFTPTDYSQVLRVGDDGSVVLPRTPVTEVGGVWLLNADGSKGTPIVGWSFDGIDRIDTRGLARVVINVTIADELGRVWVDWSAGFAAVPEDVRWSVASMVERAVSSPAPGIAGETLGDYTWRGGGYTASGAFSMSKDEMAVAHRYRPRHGSVNVAY